jgi:hypothetical protein
MMFIILDASITKVSLTGTQKNSFLMPEVNERYTYIINERRSNKNIVI